MKRVFLILTFIFITFGLNAQNKSVNWDVSHWVLAGGIGMSDILVDGTSYGIIFDPKLNLTPSTMLGSKNGLYFSTDGIIALETQAYFRWNFLRIPPGNKSASPNTTDIFIQGGIGLIGALKGPSAIELPNKEKTRSSLLFDATAGVTIPLNSRWHIEPSIRGGYPFWTGFAVTAGYKFPILQQTNVYQEGQTVTEYVEVIKTNEIIKRIMITQVEYIIFGPDVSVFNTGIDADARSLNELVLDHIAQLLKNDPNFRVRIEGHANPVTYAPGEIQVLSALSANRANEVARILREKGVEEEQIIVVALGGSRTLTSDHDRWNMNRRVELIVIQGDVN